MPRKKRSLISTWSNNDRLWKTAYDNTVPQENRLRGRNKRTSTGKEVEDEDALTLMKVRKWANRQKIKERDHGLESTALAWQNLPLEARQLRPSKRAPKEQNKQEASGAGGHGSSLSIGDAGSSAEDSHSDAESESEDSDDWFPPIDNTSGRNRTPTRLGPEIDLYSLAYIHSLSPHNQILHFTVLLFQAQAHSMARRSGQPYVPPTRDFFVAAMHKLKMKTIHFDETENRAPFTSISVGDPEDMLKVGQYGIAGEHGTFRSRITVDGRNSEGDVVFTWKQLFRDEKPNELETYAKAVRAEGVNAYQALVVGAVFELTYLAERPGGKMVVVEPIFIWQAMDIPRAILQGSTKPVRSYSLVRLHPFSNTFPPPPRTRLPTSAAEGQIFPHFVTLPPSAASSAAFTEYRSVLKHGSSLRLYKNHKRNLIERLGIECNGRY